MSLTESISALRTAVLDKIAEKDATITEQTTQITELETWKSENEFAAGLFNYRLTDTDWSYLFYGQKEMITAPELDSSNVTSMKSMFMSCNNLTTVPPLNTSKNTAMYEMFRGCYSLTTIPELDSSNVTTMYAAFNGCNSLTTVPPLDARNVTTMNLMFGNCGYLTDCRLRNIKANLQVGSGTTYGHLLTVDSLTHLIYELRDTGSSKTLTVGSANLEKLADVYVKTIDITDEMRAEDEYIDEKLPFEVCESADEGAVLITDYVVEKNWQLA